MLVRVIPLTRCSPISHYLAIGLFSLYQIIKSLTTTQSIRFQMRRISFWHPCPQNRQRLEFGKVGIIYLSSASYHVAYLTCFIAFYKNMNNTSPKVALDAYEPLRVNINRFKWMNENVPPGTHHLVCLLLPQLSRTDKQLVAETTTRNASEGSALSEHLETLTNFRLVGIVTS